MRINLIPPEDRPLKPSTIRWEFLVGAVGMVLLVLAAGLSLSERATVSHLNTQLQKSLEHRAVLQRQATVVNELRTEIRQLEGELADLESLKASGGQAELIDQVLALLEQGVWAENVSWEKDLLKVSGYAANVTQLTGYINSLEYRGHTVTIAALSPNAGGGLATFVLEIGGGSR